MSIRKISTIVGIFIFLSTTCVSAQGLQSEMAPNFNLQDTNQTPVSLKKYLGKEAVTIYFWGIWNPTSADELQVLNSAYAGLTNDGLEVLAINVGDSPETVSSYISRLNLAYQVLLDMDSTVASSYSVDVPGYVIINKDGEIVFRDSYFPYGQYNDLLSPKSE